MPSLHMPTPSGNLPKRKLLSQACTNPFSRAGSQNFRTRVRRRDWISDHRGSRAPMMPSFHPSSNSWAATYPLRDKRTEHRMADWGAGRAGSLDRNGGDLVQQGKAVSSRRAPCQRNHLSRLLEGCNTQETGSCSAGLRISDSLRMPSRISASCKREYPSTKPARRGLVM